MADNSCDKIGTVFCMDDLHQQDGVACANLKICRKFPDGFKVHA